MVTLLCAVLSTAWGGEVNFYASDFDGLGTSNSGSLVEVTKNGVTFSCDHGYGTSAHLRCYAGASLTFSSSVGKITSIIISCSGQGTSDYGPGNLELKDGGTGYSYRNYSGTWSGSAQEVSFYVIAQTRIESISVTYEGSQTGPTTTVIQPIDNMTLQVGETSDFSVSTNSDATISVVPDNTNFVTVSGSGTDWTVTAVAAGTATITVSQAATSAYTSAETSFTVTVTGSSTTGDRLLYEGFSSYEGTGDITAAINTNSPYLDYIGWSSFSQVYAGGTTNAYANGGCGKLGSSSNPGSMTTGSISLTGNAHLSFYLRKYSSSDAGKLEVTITGASVNETANPTITFTPQSTWTECTIDLTDANGNVTLSFATTSKRVYIDEITLTPVSSNTVAKPVFSVGEGTYTVAQSVEISCATQDAIIHYTTDGENPTVNSPVYTDPVQITNTGAVLKAFAVKEGLDNSRIASATYTIQPQSPILSQQDDGKIVITAADNRTDLSFYYTMGETTPSNTSTEYTGPIPLTETVTINAIAYDVYDNPSAVVSRQFKYSNIRPNPKNINSNYFVKVTDVNDLQDGDAILFVYEETAKAMSTTQNNNNRGAADVIMSVNCIDGISENIQKVILTRANDAWYFSVGNGFLYAASSTSNYLRTEDIPDENNNAKALISIDDSGYADIVFQGTNTRNILKYNSGDNLFSCYGSNSTAKKIAIYKEILTVSISDVGYASLYYDKLNLLVPTGVTAYTYTLTSENEPTISKTYNAGDVIPAGEGVILKGAKNTYTFDVATTTATKDSNNKLKGSDTGETTTGPQDETTGYLFYVLSAQTDGSNPGFYWKAQDGGAFTSAAHKVYLPIPVSGSGGVSSFLFDDMNGINETMVSNSTSGDVYTISGVKVTGTLQKGLYIINGKKVVIR